MLQIKDHKVNYEAAINKLLLDMANAKSSDAIRDVLRAGLEDAFNEGVAMSF
jgi:hypothetical protein